MIKRFFYKDSGFHVLPFISYSKYDVVSSTLETHPDVSISGWEIRRSVNGVASTDRNLRMGWLKWIYAVKHSKVHP